MYSVNVLTSFIASHQLIGGDFCRISYLTAADKSTGKLIALICGRKNCGKHGKIHDSHPGLRKEEGIYVKFR